jgi:hypothetical protein
LLFSANCEVDADFQSAIIFARRSGCVVVVVVVVVVHFVVVVVMVILERVRVRVGKRWRIM